MWKNDYDANYRTFLRLFAHEVRFYAMALATGNLQGASLARQAADHYLAGAIGFSSR